MLDSADEVARVARALVGERNRLAEALLRLSVVTGVYPSDANFLLVATTDADGLYAWLRDKGIIVRNRSRVALCEGCLRITVGTPDENAMLIDAMTAFPHD